jgi:hypothetical protein
MSEEKIITGITVSRQMEKAKGILIPQEDLFQYRKKHNKLSNSNKI